MTIEISIITACYNQGEYLNEMMSGIRDSLEGVSYEHIIVDDGSTDLATIEKLQEFSASGIRVIHQANQGLGAARNTGIKKSNGLFILPLDCDNNICPGFVRTAIATLYANPQFSIIYSDVILFGEKSGILKTGAFNLQRLMVSNYIDACAIFRRECWSALNGYDEKRVIMMWSDWDFWLRAACDGYKFHYLEIPGFFYRVHSNSMVHAAKRRTYFLAAEYFYKKHHTILGDMYLFTKLNVIKIILAKWFPKSYKIMIRLNLIKNPFSLW